jgi:hypothetical protein
MKKLSYWEFINLWIFAGFLIILLLGGFNSPENVIYYFVTSYLTGLFWQIFFYLLKVATKRRSLKLDLRYLKHKLICLWYLIFCSQFICAFVKRNGDRDLFISMEPTHINYFMDRTDLAMDEENLMQPQPTITEKQIIEKANEQPGI